MESLQLSQMSVNSELALEASQNQKAIMHACGSGDISRLKQLLNAVGVKRGDPPVEVKYGAPVPLSGPPPTSSMITTAVARKQSSVVALLLSTYPSADMCREAILYAAFRNPHLKTFKLLCAHTPDVVKIAFDYQTNALIEACRSADPLLVDYLLDNGADPNEGGLPARGPLVCAVAWALPLETIKKMVKCGAFVTSSEVNEAIREQRLDVLKFLLSRRRLPDPDNALKTARETNNKEIIALVEKRVKRDEKMKHRPGEKRTCTRKKWWQFWK